MPLESGFKRFFRRSDPTREIDEELELHVEMKTDELIGSGMTPEAARAEAEHLLGDIERLRAECRDIHRQHRRRQNRREWFGMLRQDVRYALRRGSRQPGFTVLVVVVLGLGIGANTTIFGAYNDWVLRSHPAVTAQDELVAVHRQRLRPRPRDPNRGFGHLGYLAYKERAESFAGMAAWRLLDAELQHADGSEVLSAKLVSSDYFDVLGVEMAMGRSFLPEENRSRGIHPVAVVSHALWRDRLGAEPDLEGLSIRLNEHEFHVVGVLPEGYEGFDVWDDLDVWVPLAMEGELNVRFPIWESDVFDDILSVIARLRPGVDVAQAQAELDVLASQLEPVDAESGARRRVVVDPRVRAQNLGNLSAYQRLTPVAWFSIVLLLIACVNISGLVLVRTLERRREITFRLALGAGAGRIVRQLLTESAVLAVPASVVSLAVAWGLAWLMEIHIGPQLDLSPDYRVVVFSLLLALVASVLVGLAPAFQAIRFGRRPGAVEGPTPSGGRPRLLTALVVVQLGGTLILLIGAGSFVRTLQKAHAADLGFERDNLILLEPDLHRAGYELPEARQFYDEVQARLSELPGITSVATAGVAPRFTNGIVRWHTLRLWREGPEAHPPMTIEFNVVAPSYFETLGVEIVAGRGFSPGDGEAGPDVALVNETLARALWGRSPRLGDRVRLAGPRYDSVGVEVVGVVADVRTFVLHDAPPPELFLPVAQSTLPNRVVMARTVAGAAGLVPEIRREIGRIDPRLPPQELESMHQRIQIGLTDQQTWAELSTVFGVLALLLAGVGLYATVGFAVSRRTKEFGIRLALGARSPTVLRMVLVEGLTMTAAGVAIGLAGAVWLLGITRRIFYIDVGAQLTRLDPAVVAVCIFALGAAALAACWRPARKATATDPMATLRYE